MIDVPLQFQNKFKWIKNSCHFDSLLNAPIESCFNWNYFWRIMLILNLMLKLLRIFESILKIRHFCSSKNSFPFKQQLRRNLDRIKFDKHSPHKGSSDRRSNINHWLSIFEDNLNFPLGVKVANVDNCSHGQRAEERMRTNLFLTVKNSISETPILNFRKILVIKPLTRLKFLYRCN